MGSVNLNNKQRDNNMTKALAFLAAMAFTAVLSAPAMADHHKGHAKGEKHECKDCKDKKHDKKNKKNEKADKAADHAEEAAPEEGHDH